MTTKQANKRSKLISDPFQAKHARVANNAQLGHRHNKQKQLNPKLLRMYGENNSGGSASTNALISTGANLVGAGINAWSTATQNKKNREFQSEQYDKEVANSREMWELQNSYNSPEQQMARLQKAGLNPNLVYGNGNAVNTASTPNTPHAQPFHAEAPRFDIPQIVGGYFNALTQSQSLSNQQKQGTLLDAETAYKIAQAKQLNNSNIWMTGTYDLRMQKLIEDIQGTVANNIRTRLTNDAIRLDNLGRPIKNQLLTLQGQMLNKNIENKGYQNVIDKGASDFSRGGLTLKELIPTLIKIFK